MRELLRRIKSTTTSLPTGAISLRRHRVEVSDVPNAADAFASVSMRSQFSSEVADVHVDAPVERRQLTVEDFLHEFFASDDISAGAK
jgi:hypothetical protein